MKRHNLLLILALVTFFAIISFGLLIGFWAIYPYKTISFKTMPFKIVGSRTLKAGDFLTYEVEYTKYTDVVPTQYKHFQDGLVFQIAPESAMPVITGKDSGKAIFSIQIPETLPEGEYFIHTDTYYEMNPIRTIHEESYTEKFTVIK